METSFTEIVGTLLCLRFLSVEAEPFILLLEGQGLGQLRCQSRGGAVVVVSLCQHGSSDRREDLGQDPIGVLLRRGSARLDTPRQDGLHDCLRGVSDLVEGAGRSRHAQALLLEDRQRRRLCELSGMLGEFIWSPKARCRCSCRTSGCRRSCRCRFSAWSRRAGRSRRSTPRWRWRSAGRASLCSTSRSSGRSWPCVSFVGSSYGLEGLAYAWLAFPAVFLITTSITVRLISLSLADILGG